jgi:hypothetical protein
MDYKLLLALTSLMMLVSACERNSGGKAKLSIQFPEVTSSTKSEKVSASGVGGSSDDWANITPSGLTGATPINCFGVYISGPEDSFKKNSCGKKDFTTPMKTFGMWKGGVPAGASLSFDVDAGKDRVVGIFGFHATDMTACKDFTGNSEMDKSKLSMPYFIGESAPQVFAPGSSVNVPVTLAFNSDQSFEDCKGPDFGNNNGGGGGGSSSSIYVGSGADGDLVVTSPLTDVRNINSPSKGVPLISMTRVKGISVVGGNSKNLSLTTQYDGMGGRLIAGDEVALYVPASYGSTGCGPSLFPGFRTSGIVSSASGTNAIVQVDDERFATIPSASLLASAADTGRDFCRMILVRVPNLNTLTINGGTLSYNAASFGDMTGTSDHEAGFMMIRVKDKILVQSSGGIDVSSRGFSGGNYSLGTNHYDGQGVNGASLQPPTGANVGNGGAGSMNTGASPGGGGHGGSGGNAYATGMGGYSVGDQYGCGSANYDAQMKCLFGKIFMGGSGGAGYDANGGYGGGIIHLIANSIILNTQTLTLNADGGNGLGGSTMGGAGGAGGAVLVEAYYISGSGSGTLKMRSNGGFSKVSSGSGFGKGGSGGGGRNHLNVLNSCSIGSLGIVMESYGAGSYAANTGSAGATGTNFLSGSSGSSCSPMTAMNISPYVVNVYPSYLTSDTTNGVQISIYGESFSGIQQVVLQRTSNLAEYPATINSNASGELSFTTMAPAAQYNLIVTGASGHKTIVNSALTLN